MINASQKLLQVATSFLHIDSSVTWTMNDAEGCHQGSYRTLLQAAKSTSSKRKTSVPFDGHVM